jgi:beta-lactam-binding protein with PASTA domain
MAPILDARGSGDFPPADPAVVIGNTRPVPGCSEVFECARVLAAAGFQSTTVRVNGDRPNGALMGTSPARGSRAVPGQVVSILVSNGANYVEPAPEPPTPEPPPEPPAPPPTTEPPEQTQPAEPPPAEASEPVETAPAEPAPSTPPVVTLPPRDPRGRGPLPGR